MKTAITMQIDKFCSLIPLQYYIQHNLYLFISVEIANILLCCLQQNKHKKYSHAQQDQIVKVAIGTPNKFNLMCGYHV